MVWKLENKGIPERLVGYTQEHTRNVYKMLNLQTHKIILCRDIQWLHKTFGAYHNLSRNQVTKIIELEVPSGMSLCLLCLHTFFLFILENSPLIASRHYSHFIVLG